MYYLRLFDPWKGKFCTCQQKYSLSPYTGCAHRCLYCYITTYIPRAFHCRPKPDFIKKLPTDLNKADKNIPVTIANSSDPYPPVEKELKLTREMLKLLTKFEFKILLVTKSDIFLRDLDIISNANIAVTVTITSINEDLIKRLEPGAPGADKRLRAVELLILKELPVMVRIDPIIPALNEELEPLLKRLSDIGVKYITSSTYKARPDSLNRLSVEFPEHSASWQRLYKQTGRFVNRSWYLDKSVRENLMRNVSVLAKKYGLKFNMCREGLPVPTSSPSCDGAHLLK